SLLRSLQFESAVISCGAVGREEICRRGAPLVVIDAASEFTQVRFAIELPPEVMRLHFERHRITEVEGATVCRAKPRLTKRIALPRHQAAKPAVMPVHFADPP